MSVPGKPWFCIAGLWRTSPEVGEAWTMLIAPGPHVAPYHNRQIVLLSPQDCIAWLDPAASAEPFVQPLPQGSLAVTAA